jgi:hypothetical protein
MGIIGQADRPNCRACDQEWMELDSPPAAVSFALAVDGKAASRLMKIRNQLAAIVSLAS